MHGKWAERASGRPVYLEIGCGKGKFISEMAEREPGRYFVAVEGNQSVMLRAMEKVRAKSLDNVAFVPEFAEDLSDWFSDGEVTGIYLNFSDPLPKNYWYRRRLTYRERLKSYFRVLAEDGTVTFKTDNTGLFEWTIPEIMAADLKILDITRDLHAEAASIEDPAERAAFNIETEYEAKFSGLGEKIKRVVIGRGPERTAAEQHTDTETDKGEPEMKITSMAAFNGRDIPERDRNFTAVGNAKAAIAKKGKEAVVNATVGALYDDDANLVVLDSVARTFRELSGTDFAEYAPIAGTPEFKDAVIKAAFGDYTPKSYVKAVAAPGGTGAVRLAVDNYSCPADRILTHSYYWAPYESMANELGRGFETFETFNEEGGFNIEDFEYKIKKLTRNQEHLTVILNTPAANPTGYALSEDDWQGVKRVLDEVPLEKKIALVIDAAYMDYAGTPEEVRKFLPIADKLRSNILPMIAYSASKTFTIYGFRAGALICLAHSPEIAEEFEKLCSFAARNTWSNPSRPAMTTVAKIMNDEGLRKRTDDERAKWRSILEARTKAFDEEAEKAGLKTLPHGTAFFVTVPCEDPDKAGDILEKQDVCLIRTKGGLRVTVASVSEEKCRRLPAIIKEALSK